MINLDSDIIYLNHAAVAPWPQSTVDAVKAFAEENGKTGAKNYLSWLEQENALRQKLQTLINAPSVDDISLLKSTSEGLSFVASGINWNKGDNIVFFAQEFPSNRVVWESLKPQGVDIRKVDLYQEDPEQALLNEIDDKTKLISISSVQYARGLKMDLAKISQACQDNNILFCVDAIQSLGISPLDVQALKIDFLVADGHKWLLGPEGLALFYCSAKLRDSLQLAEFGWHMLAEASDYDAQNWSPAPNGKRFECGSPNMLATMALHASVSLLLQTGIELVESRIRKNVHYLISALNELPDMEILSVTDKARLAGILTFKHKSLASEELYAKLMAQNLICAPRGGGLRFSPHFYQDQELMDRALNCLEDTIRSHQSSP